MIVASFLAHFWHYEFGPVGEPWYHGQVWGNVVAVLPLAILGGIGFIYHHFVLRRLHRQLEARHDQHNTHLRTILDALDPETDGGIAILLDRMDESTPHGIRAAVDAVATLRAEIVHNGCSQAEPEIEPHSGG